MTDLRLENLTPFAHSAQNRCFGRGQANPTGLHLEFFLAQDGAVVCPATIPISSKARPDMCTAV